MTDLEKHVNQPGRAKLIKNVREKINELGITYIYFQFISVTGRVVGKGIPADHWERTAEKGFQLVYGATANLFLDRHNNYIGYGPEAKELVGIPDPETCACESAAATPVATPGQPPGRNVHQSLRGWS